MNENFNWSGFYLTLCQHGPDLLMGIDGETRGIIRDVASTTDMFWSDGLQDCLAGGAAEDDLLGGVLSALELWRENVLQALDSDFGIELDWQAVSIDTTSPLIADLVEAAAAK
jgi:hypothetical protein